MPLDDDKKIDGSKMTPEEGLLHSQFITDLQQDAAINGEQRDQANVAMRFVLVRGGQWEDFLEDQFDGRVRMEFNLVSDAIRDFLGEWSENRVAVDYRPTDDAATESDSMVLNNLFRTDFRQFSGKEALDNAVQEMTISGPAYIKVGTKHEDEEDDQNENRRITFSPIYNGFNSVFFNKGAQRKDKKDAIHCTVLTELNEDEFRRRWPGRDPVSVFSPQDRKEFNFDTSNPNNVYIATRYGVLRGREKVFIYDNTVTNKKEVFTEKEHEEEKSAIKNDPNLRFSEERIMRPRIIKKAVFSGAEFLEAPKTIAGKWIPICPFYAFRGYTDGVEWWSGLVQDLIDPQRLFNMQISQLAENAAMQSTDIPIVDPKQITPEYQSDWEDLPNAPYVRMEALRDKDGNIVHQGPLGFLKAPNVSPSMQALLQVVPAFMHDKTGQEPVEGRNKLESGKAKLMERKLKNIKTRPIMENIFDGIEHLGEIYQSIATDVYADRKEMVLLKEDGTESMQKLVETKFDEDLGQLAEVSSLRNKKFRAYADVGPQFETQREADVETLKDLIEISKDNQALQPYLPHLVAELFSKLPAIGKGVKKFNRDRMLTLGMIKPETPEEEQQVLQAQQNQQSEEQKLMESMGKQAESEAEERTSKVADNLASAQKKGAETQKILRELPLGTAKTLTEIRKIESDINEQTFQNVEGLPLN